MALLILGLVLFLGAHSTRIFAENWRQAALERLGEKAFKGANALVSLVGFGLLIVGFDQVRWDSPALWVPPVWVKHLAALLMLLSLVLLACAHAPRNAIKAKLHHPMVLSVKVWALAHLLANPRVADLVLFGAFLLWSVLNFRAARQRDRLAAAEQETGEAGRLLAPEVSLAATLRAVGIGVVVWAILLSHGHVWLFGVSPLG
ncbi:MAG: NnrU family protein [Burkholderiales bacterium]|nr:NnrU family protein [Burkholderiales bacterium]